MFDERVPREIRESLGDALAGRRWLERALVWIGAYSGASTEWDEIVRAELDRMEAAAWRLVERYRCGELTLDDFETRLEAEFAWNRPPSPELEAWLARNAESRSE